MSKKINIEGLVSVVDPSYRYTMTRLNVVRQKNRTVIDNVNDVCKDLEREPKLLMDFFKKKLGVAFIFKDGCWGTSADVKYDQLFNALREFIEYYVLCEKCKLPETNIEFNKGEMMMSCKCCSYDIIKNAKHI